MFWLALVKWNREGRRSTRKHSGTVFATDQALFPKMLQTCYARKRRSKAASDRRWMTIVRGPNQHHPANGYRTIVRITHVWSSGGLVRPLFHHAAQQTSSDGCYFVRHRRPSQSQGHTFGGHARAPYVQHKKALQQVECGCTTPYIVAMELG